ncbi:MAG TPA: formylglycine-generating enzyme family protein [Brumimicrobium sp.]|nr:formylglycine-generating enzyme family protein [Brumimicrobium sp.]
MALIKGGTYIPLYGTDSMPVKVDNFQIDKYPVTNAEFIQFLKENPKWKKSNVIALYADGNYMRHFKDDFTLNEGENPNAPMTNVSWFAAKKYCECEGKRLPTLDEWEYVGMADEKRIDARSKDDYNKFILSWYEKPNTYSQEIGSTFKNYWGVYDMHGLVWEWTQDFNSVLISGESRKDVDGSSNLFCGGAALGSSDLMNYAAFMRYAFRGSVKANYSIRTLGFRCATSIK